MPEKIADLNSDTTYIVLNVKGNSALEADNKRIVGSPINRNQNQQWYLERSGDGWTFKSLGLNAYLAVSSELADGTSCVIGPTPFVWDIQKDEDYDWHCRIFVPGTEYNIELSDYGSTDPGTPVLVWRKWNGRHQLWHFERGKSSLFNEFKVVTFCHQLSEAIIKSILSVHRY